MRALTAILLILCIVGLGVGWYSFQRAARAQMELDGLRVRLANARVELETSSENLKIAEATRSSLNETSAILTKARADHAAALKRIAELELDLKAEIARRNEVDHTIEKTAELLRKERERHNKEIWEARRFMPEGVRLNLVTLNDQLRADQYPEFRFLKAMQIEDKVLRDVQALGRDETTMSSTIYIAKEVTFDIDRDKGVLRITFKHGYRRGPKGREELGAEGKVLEFPDIDGRSWESRLPFLVKATGQYPAILTKKPALPRMESSRRAGWLKRINALLAKAKTDKQLKLETFRTLQNGRFHEALLLGYDKSKKLAMSAEAQWLAVRVDDRGKYVELVLADGTLRRSGGESPIPKSGYRIRLTGIEPKQAIDGMLGMVKR